MITAISLETIRSWPIETIIGLDKETRNEVLGVLGEACIEQIMRERGHDAKRIDFKFDHRADLTIDGVLAEVKTQYPWVNEKAFTFRPNQLPKCRGIFGAERLFFVDVKNGKIYEVEQGYATRVKRTKDNRDMILVNINQPQMHFFADIPEDAWKEMRQFTDSDYDGARKKKPKITRYVRRG